MLTEEQRQKAFDYVTEQLEKRAVLDPETSYQDEIDSIVDDAEARLNPATRDHYTDVIDTGQKDAKGNDVTFTAVEIDKAARA